MNHTGIVEMRSVIQRVVTLQETFQEVLAGLTKLATGTLATVAVLFAPLVHRFLHRFHLEEE